MNVKKFIKHLLAIENYSFSFEKITQHTDGKGRSQKFELARLIDKKGNCKPKKRILSDNSAKVFQTGTVTHPNSHLSFFSHKGVKNLPKYRGYHVLHIHWDRNKCDTPV